MKVIWKFGLKVPTFRYKLILKKPKKMKKRAFKKLCKREDIVSYLSVHEGIVPYKEEFADLIMRIMTDIAIYGRSEIDIESEIKDIINPG